MALLLASPALAEKGKLRERLTPEVMAVVFPGGAERLGPEEGSPPAIAVYQGDKVVAYVFSTLDIIAAPGYSTTPFDVIGGVDLTGHITGAKVVFHNEPYILHEVARQRLLDTFLAREAGRPLRGGTNLRRSWDTDRNRHASHAGGRHRPGQRGPARPAAAGRQRDAQKSTVPQSSKHILDDAREIRHLSWAFRLSAARKNGAHTSCSA